MNSIWALPFRADVWGTVGQWASVLFAGAAAIISAFSAFVALSIVRRDRERADWDDAYKVGVDVTARFDHLLNSIERAWVVNVKVANGGSRLISNVRISLVHRGVVLKRPSVFGEETPSPQEISTIKRQQISSVDFKGNRGGGLDWSMDELLSVHNATVEFDDTKGNRWILESWSGRISRTVSRKHRWWQLTEMISNA